MQTEGPGTVTAAGSTQARDHTADPFVHRREVLEYANAEVQKCRSKAVFMHIMVAEVYIDFGRARDSGTERQGVRDGRTKGRL